MSITDQNLEYRVTLWRNLLVMGAAITVLVLFADHFPTLDVPALVGFIQNLSLLQWAGGLVLAFISFAAVGRYDALVAGVLRLPVDSKLAVSVGWRATALSQLTGFGLITGSLVRWRLLSRNDQMGPVNCTTLTVIVCAVFFTGWAMVTSAVVLLAPTILPGGKAIAAIGFTFGLLTLGVLAFPPSPVLKLAAARRLPSCRAGLEAIVLAFVDTFAAAAIIYLFLPEGYVPFIVLYAAFLVAFAGGMVSGLPGGVGAFDLCILVLLPVENTSPLIAALCAYRIVYHFIPAAIAGVGLLKPFDHSTPPSPLQNASGLPLQLRADAPPEIGLLGNGPLGVAMNASGTSAILSCQTPNNAIALGDTFGCGSSDDLRTALKQDARQQRKGLCFYKCSARQALILRREGFKTSKIGQEAILNPEIFTLESRQFRQLRRKLRNAKKAGIEIEKGGADLKELAEIDAAWQGRNDGARGFSMGVFCKRHISRQLILTAKCDGVVLAYMTFHRAEKSWSLDLVRSVDKCPDGTMHALIMRAVEMAKPLGINRLSLAAAPFSGISGDTVYSKLMQLVYRKNPRLAGLFQFKQSFAPRWEPIYIAAVSNSGLFFGAVDLFRLIQGVQTAHPSFDDAVHNDYVDYEFASHKGAWQTEHAAR